MSRKTKPVETDTPTKAALVGEGRAPERDADAVAAAEAALAALAESGGITREEPEAADAPEVAAPLSPGEATPPAPVDPASPPPPPVDA